MVHPHYPLTDPIPISDDHTEYRRQYPNKPTRAANFFRPARSLRLIATNLYDLNRESSQPNDNPATRANQHAQPYLVSSLQPQSLTRHRDNSPFLSQQHTSTHSLKQAKAGNHQTRYNPHQLRHTCNMHFNNQTHCTTRDNPASTEASHFVAVASRTNHRLLPH